MLRLKRHRFKQISCQENTMDKENYLLTGDYFESEQSKLKQTKEHGGNTG